jgi:hypothetical protein
MITEISSKKTFNLKIYGVPFFFVLFLLSLFLIIHPGPNDKSIVSLLFACFFSAMLLFLVLIIILQIIFIPNGVIIDDDLKQLTLKYLATKQKIIPLNDIGAYKKISIYTRAGPCYGVVIYLPKEKPVLLSDLNLDGYMPVKQFLDNLNVSNIGEGRFSFMPYFMHQ